MTAKAVARIIVSSTTNNAEFDAKQAEELITQYVRELCEPYKKAMREFIDRVDKGNAGNYFGTYSDHWAKVRSMETYTKFKKLLKEEK